MQMVNTVLKDQKLLIQYLSNISWSHSFTKYKLLIQYLSNISCSHMVSLFYQIQAAIFKNALNAILKKMTMTTMMRYRRPLVSGDTNLGIMTLEVMQCAHWLCSVHIGCCALVQCAHFAHWPPLIARESHFRQLDLATLLLVRFPDPLADELWVRGPFNSQSHTLLLMHIRLQSQSWLILFV